jgi:hypothetical protein
MSLQDAVSPARIVGVQHLGCAFHAGVGERGGSERDDARRSREFFAEHGGTNGAQPIEGRIAG